ncbi:hypothetical protein [Fuchsiella alkaliacetigena]|uniref:hypothetical protein n=1 Tax=Fuchsiella alkaliacetigena TaxID=957042 RepID=UPI00200A057D|nr:hypothetical protein [Fuchsiella alkaliacetigena]MCK8826014.1 hypothetical protein [Fuchsiella alkaliacetigena]
MSSKKLLIVLIIISSLFQMTGCEREPEETPDNQSSLPTSLLRVNGSKEEIVAKLEEIDSMIEEIEKSEEKEFEEGEAQEEGAEEREVEEEGAEEREVEEEGAEEEEKKEKVNRIQELWAELEEEVKELHQNWNQYESEESVEQLRLARLEEELNSLTEAIAEEQLIPALLTINQFDLEIAELYYSHNFEIEGRFKKLRAHIRKIIYQHRLVDSSKDELSELEMNDKLLALISKLENDLINGERIEQKIIELRKAIKDLAEAVSQQRTEVIEVKAELALARVNELEELHEGD